MTCAQVLSSLKAEANEKTAALYVRHGAGNQAIGASFTFIEKLRRKIKRDHALARELWNSGHFEARYLAAQIADPEQFSSDQLDEWLKELDSPTLVDCFVANIAAKSVHGEKKLREWIASPDEYIARAGWQLVIQQALRDPDMPDFYFLKFLKPIEKHIHTAPNRTRQAMNQALIAIGGRGEFLAKYALNAAARIGRVEVDHGETDCATPDATDCIQKILKRKQIAIPQLTRQQAKRKDVATPKAQTKRAAS